MIPFNLPIFPTSPTIRPLEGAYKHLLIHIRNETDIAHEKNDLTRPIQNDNISFRLKELGGNGGASGIEATAGAWVEFRYGAGVDMESSPTHYCRFVIAFTYIPGVYRMFISIKS